MINQREDEKPASQHSNIHTIFNILIPTVIFSLVIGVVYTYGKHRERIMLEYGNYTVEQVSLNIADEIRMTVDYGSSSILNIATSVGHVEINELLENPSEYIRPLVDSSPFGNIEFICEDGMNIMNIGEPFDASNRPYYIEGIKGNTGIWNNYHPKLSKETLINFYTPFIYKNEIRGVITGYIEATSQIKPVLKKEFFTQPVYAILYDGDGMVISSTLAIDYEPDMTLGALLRNYGDDEAEINRYVSLLLKETNGPIKFINKVGEGRICVRAIPDTDWKVAVIVSAETFRAIFGNDIKYTLKTIVSISILLVLYLFHMIGMKAKENRLIKKENSSLEIENQKFSDENKKTYAELEKLNLKLKMALENGARYITDMIRYASSEADADKILVQLIEYLGINTKSDGVYLFERIDEFHFKNTYEWCAEGIPKKKDTLQNIAFDGAMGIWMEEFEKHGMLIIKNMEEYKSVCEPAYKVLKALNITSLAAVPLLINEKIVGFIGVENPHADDTRNVAGFLNLVEFFFTMMIRMRDNVNLLQMSAVHDQLTGCKNRKALVWALNDDFNKDESMAVFAFDMNGLKKINDNLGHEAGDKYICNTANMLRSFFGDDNVYRMGGDEFLAVMTGKTREEMDALKNACAAEADTVVSIGYVFAEKVDVPFASLMKKADFDMYAAKADFYSLNK